MGHYNTKYFKFHPCVGVSFIEMSSGECVKGFFREKWYQGLIAIYKPGFHTQSTNFGLSPPSTRLEKITRGLCDGQRATSSQLEHEWFLIETVYSSFPSCGISGCFIFQCIKILILSQGFNFKGRDTQKHIALVAAECEHALWPIRTPRPTCTNQKVWTVVTAKWPKANAKHSLVNRFRC